MALSSPSSSETRQLVERLPLNTPSWHGYTTLRASGMAMLPRLYWPSMETERIGRRSR